MIPYISLGGREETMVTGKYRFKAIYKETRMTYLNIFLWSCWLWIGTSSPESLVSPTTQQANELGSTWEAMDCFLYNRDLCHERVKVNNNTIKVKAHFLTLFGTNTNFENFDQVNIGWKVGAVWTVNVKFLLAWIFEKWFYIKLYNII